MARTVYEQNHADDSHKAHLAARRDIYPSLFGNEDIEYEICSEWDSAKPRNRILDGELGIDVVARPGTRVAKHSEVFPAKRMNPLAASLHFYIQARFSDYTAAELDLHRKFADKRLRGEWFDLDADDLLYITGLTGDSS